MEKIRYDHLKPYLPNIIESEARLVKYWWRAFDECPERYKNTELPDIIEEWLKHVDRS